MRWAAVEAAQGARNAGWRATSGDVVAFVDDDVRVAPGWRAAVPDAVDAVDFACGRVTVPPEQAGAERPVAVTPDVPETRLDAAENLADLPQIEAVADRVDRALRRGTVGQVDLVVLDPPRTGAKREVVSAIAKRDPRAVAYVACDPAALARDVGTFAEHGYSVRSLRAFDLFPMTHHVECVAVLARHDVS